MPSLMNDCNEQFHTRNCSLIGSLIGACPASVIFIQITDFSRPSRRTRLARPMPKLLGHYDLPPARRQGVAL